MTAALKEFTSPTETDFHQKISALGPLILKNQEQIELQRRIPIEIIDALKAAGVFRMTMPKDWGGLELDPIEQLKAIEQLAWFDASVGWCVMIGCDGGLYTGFLDQNIAKSVFSDIDGVTASALTATGKATITAEGFQVQGRWPFVSGCQHSDWFLLGCSVYRDGEQQFLPGGAPQTVQCLISAQDVQILDTWNATGLRGSGSHDVTVDSVLVPKERTFTYQDLHFHRPHPLYAFPLNIILNFSSVPIGVAQRALDELLKCADRPSRITLINNQLSEKRTLKDEPYVQDAVGRASSKLQATRTYLYSTIGDIWSCLQAGAQPPPDLFARFQALNAFVYDECTEMTESLYKVRGGSAVYHGSPFDRCLRDLLTMNQHVMNSRRSYSMAGRVLLGLPPEQILL